jgi:MFS family permease
MTAMFTGFQKTYRRFSRQFWILMFVTFVDMLGGALIFPFFALFITQKFNVGMTQVGTMFLVWALTSSMIGNTLGGAMADKFGRKTNMIVGLVASAFSALLMLVINDFNWFFLAIGVVGVFQDIAGPARNAMIADLVSEDMRAEAFGMHRIVYNASATIGPLIGGLVASRSFAGLFIADVVISVAMAVFVFFKLPETKPQEVSREHADADASFRQTFKGYRQVLKDKLFITFGLITLLQVLVYIQMNSTLSVFLRNVHGLPIEHFGYMLSLNAFMVVTMQMAFTRLVSKRSPMLVCALGSLLYAVGFGMFGVINTYGWFIVAMVIITIGEMIVSPIEHSLVADFAPGNMRGRYMAIFGFVWIIPWAVGPLGAGLIMDRFDPRLIWVVAFGLGLLSMLGYLWLHARAGEKFAARQNGNGKNKPAADVAVAGE